MKNNYMTRARQGLFANILCLTPIFTISVHAQPKINFSVDRVPQVEAPQTIWAFGDDVAIPNAVHDDFLILGPDQSSQIYLHLTDFGLEGTNELEIPAVDLGLSNPVDFFNLDALMRNRGELTEDPFTNIFFSIEDRPGRAEGAVSTQVEFDSLLAYTTDPQAFPNGPATPGDGSIAGTVYYALTNILSCRGRNFTSPSLLETALGLKPDRAVGDPNSQQDEDNLDALNISEGDAPDWQAPELAYFSIVNDWANIPVFTPAAIWISTQDGAFSPFATAESMGLVGAELDNGNVIAGDDVDAIVVFDSGTEGVLEPGTDKALFSVRSIGTSELDPGTVFYTEFDGTFAVADPTNINVAYELLAANLGLNSDDQNGDGRIREQDGEDPDIFDELNALESLQVAVDDLPQPPFDPPPPPAPPIPPVPPIPTRLPPGADIFMLDWGDNPLSYGLAIHQTYGGDRIGERLDWEFPGLPSIDSLLDDQLSFTFFGIPAPNLFGRPFGPRRLDNGDDEDGVTFNPGGTLRADVLLTSFRRPAFRSFYGLDMYFDTNADGVYTLPPLGTDITVRDAPIDLIVPNALQSFTIRQINLGFDATAVNSRFRLGYDPNNPRPQPPPVLPPAGFTLNGEVEDEGVRPVRDFGDAPDDDPNDPNDDIVVDGVLRRYQTLLVNNGPLYDEARLQHFGMLPGPLSDCHALVSPPGPLPQLPDCTVNAMEDGELDGQPTVNANGDDIGVNAAGPISFPKRRIPVLPALVVNDDEDGIGLAPDLVTVDIEIRRPGTNTYLINGWIDCNDSGTFNDDNDFIQDIQNLAPGVHQFFYIPDCDPTEKYSRFRLTLADGIGVPPNPAFITPFGEFVSGDGYSHGEVEDYAPDRVQIAAADQLHLVGPQPNRVPAGEQGSINASVQAQFVGVSGEEVVFTKLLGNFNFTSGTISADGISAMVTTDSTGSATMTFVSNEPGTALVKVSVESAGLNAFSLFFITP